jgi:uncharacterized membrane protein
MCGTRIGIKIDIHFLETKKIKKNKNKKILELRVNWKFIINGLILKQAIDLGYTPSTNE